MRFALGNWQYQEPVQGTTDIGVGRGVGGKVGLWVVGTRVGEMVGLAVVGRSVGLRVGVMVGS